MPNFNININLSKLPGAKVMDIQGENETRRCVVLPIDNEDGVIYDEYLAKQKDGSMCMKPMNDVHLSLTAYQFREPRFGHSHGVKISYNGKTLERKTEEDLRKIPFIGHMASWFSSGTMEDNKNKNNW